MFALRDPVAVLPGSHGTGTLLKTVSTQYSGNTNPRSDIYTFDNTGTNMVPTTITTTWANGKTAQETKSYDSGYTFAFYDATQETTTNYPLVYGSVTQSTASDYGANSQPGPVIKKAVTQYLWTSDSTYLNGNFLNLPSSVQIFEDGGASQAGYTQYTYGDTVQSSGVTMQHNSSPSAPHRGNLVTTARWLNGSVSSTSNCGTSVSNGNLNSTASYYDTGAVYQSTDPCSHTTTFSYSSTYYGAYVTQTNFPDTNSPNLAHHAISGTYDFDTGLLASFTDENSKTSSYSYDSMWRFTSASFPDSGAVNFYYPDAVTIERTQKLDASRNTDLYVRFDGVGREIRRITANDESTPWDQVDTCYDVRGFKSFVSYPYQGSGLSSSQVCSGLGDAFAYDPLGRVTTVTHSDGTTVTSSYAGAATSVTDEGNGTRPIQKITQVDGLGRLLSVCEVTSTTQLGLGGTPSACGQDISGTGFLTSYAYSFDSGTSNLKFTVSQGSLNQRVSAANSLGWLVSAANPESGTTTYGYDADGNVISRVAPAPNQSSGSVTTTITYDPLHRVRTKSYSDNSTPTATVNYDEGSAFTRTLTNTTGRESSAYATTVQNPITTQAAEVFSYDTMGRVLDNSQCTPQNCTGSVFPVTYSYDYLGDALTGTNGLGTTLTYSYNRAARLTGVTSSLSDANHPGTLLSGVHYNAFGGDTAATLGNNVVESLGYAPRGWLQSLNATLNSTSLYSFSLGFAANGDVTSGNDSVNGNWNYAYDDFNRLCASNKGGQQSLTCTSSNNTGQQAFKYVYDRYGNRWQQNVTAGSGPAPQYGFDANNHITSGSGVSYDAAGNVTNDGSHSYTYDAENRIIKVDNGTTAAYVYDAAGNRIRKTTGSVSVDYLYDLSGHVVTEVTSSGGWNRGEVFAGGHHIATYSGGTSGTISFTHADWLGTERKRTDKNGASIETCTNLPFGDGQSCTGTDVSPLHFTGKQRDTETNSDDFGARYFNSGMARWLTPDWSARPEGVPYATFANPQTLNLYAYVGNNPVTHTDPDGHKCVGLCQGGEWIQFYDVEFGLDVDNAPQPDEYSTQTHLDSKAQQQNGTIPGTSQPAALQPPKPPTNASQKTEYPSQDAAGVAAEKRTNPRSIAENREYAGWLTKNADGTYSIGHANPGTERGSDPGPRPSNAAGEYHTHGGPSPGAEHFSRGKGQDLDFGRKQQVPMYLGTPSGRILKFDPGTGRISILNDRTDIP